MLDVSLARRISLEEVGEMQMSELSLWAAHLTGKEKRWDKRFGILCSTIAQLETGEDEWPAEYFFPSLAEAPAEANLTIEPQVLTEIFKGWCVAAGGKVIESEPEKE
jgi:hypothetical protein